MKRLISIVALSLLFSSVYASAQFITKPPKNIIIMIADGWGFNQVLATNYYTHGTDSAQVYEGFPVKLAIGRAHV